MNEYTYVVQTECCYLDCGVFGVLLEEERDALREVLGLSNNVMHFRHHRNVLTFVFCVFLVLCSNTT